MIRVLMYCNQFHPIVGGAERQAQRLAVALKKQDVHAEVLTPRIDPGSPPEEEIDGIKVHRFELTDLSKKLKVPGIGIPNVLIQRAQIRRAVRQQMPEFDLLHAHLASPGACFAMEVAHDLGRKAICKVACGGPDFDLPKIDTTSKLGPIWRRRLVSELDRWIAISEEIGEDLRHASVDDDRIAVIPNGIDPTSFEPASDSRPIRNFLYLGRLEKCDVETLIASFDRLLEEEPDCRLRISGGGDQGPAQKSIELHSRGAERTDLPGVTPADAEYAWADAVVHPTFAEGVSNTLLEAMSIGIPCIASDIWPNREVLADGDAGLLFAWGKADSLSAHMLRLIEDASLSTKLVESARRRIDEQYHFDRIAERYVELYRDLCANLPRKADRA